jgi:hypothetical protein
MLPCGWAVLLMSVASLACVACAQSVNDLVPGVWSQVVVPPRQCRAVRVGGTQPHSALYRVTTKGTGATIVTQVHAHAQCAAGSHF